jgi:hypothetical protein
VPFIEIVGEVEILPKIQTATLVMIKPQVLKSPRLLETEPVNAKVEVNPPLANVRSFPLDQEVEDLKIGATMLVDIQLSSGLLEERQYAPYFFERKVTNATPASGIRGPLSGGTTVVELDKQLTPDIPPANIKRPITVQFQTDIRSIEFHEVNGDRITLFPAREQAPYANGSRLYYFGDLDSYKKLDGRRLQLLRDNQFEEVSVSIESEHVGREKPETLRPLFLNPPLHVFTIEDFPFDNPTVSVYGNLVDATQGKTEKEADLGNGDSRRKFQTFKLPKAPLTYHNSPGETPPEVSELQIYVNDRLWKRVPSFFGNGPKEEIYIVREDANGDSWVQFGDGKTGKRLPSGIKNVVAKYRTGTGAYGTLKEETTVQPGDKLDRLDKIQLLDVVSGASEPESGDNAREAAPGKTQSLARLVSLKDFESEALAISGVSKTLATWNLVDSIPVVALTVLMETGRDKEFDEVHKMLTRYNRCRGLQRFPIDVRSGKRLYVYVDAIYGLHPSYREHVVEKAIKESLGVSGDEGDGIDGSHGLFGIHQRRFGQNEYATKIEGTIQNVEGVVWAKVKALGSLGENDDPSKLDYPPISKDLKDVSCDNLHILTLYKNHLNLLGSKVVSVKECSDE